MKGYICTHDPHNIGQKYKTDIIVYDSILHMCHGEFTAQTPYKYEVRSGEPRTVTIVRKIPQDEFNQRSTGIFIEYRNKLWYNRGVLHRYDGPAMVGSDGATRWYVNDRLNREDGPAVIHADGRKSWYIDNRLHREDGPAVIYADGTNEWFIWGRPIEPLFGEN